MPHPKGSVWKIIWNCLGILRQSKHQRLHSTPQRNLHPFTPSRPIKATILHPIEQPTLNPQITVTPFENLHTPQAHLQLMQAKPIPKTRDLPPRWLIIHWEIVQPQLLHELRHNRRTIREHLWPLGSIRRWGGTRRRYEAAVRGDIHRRADLEQIGPEGENC